MTTQALFSELENVTKENIHYLEQNVLPLTPEQLNWKPRQDVWNVKEVIAHVYEHAKYYHSAFSKKIDTTKFREPKDLFLSSPLGKSMWKSMKLGNARNVKRKMKAARLYNPLIVKSIVTEHVIADFLASQKELLNILERAKTINIRKAKIRLVGNNVIKFRFGDTLLLVVYHNQRHIQQVINLIQHPKFPQP
ncbi:DinB family protein [Crocinitomicaceae bacterium CZZ-1]|uniref:DinB family protein n=1 Tax=Taishania pollutisoli TaxID=2766479 RepID=A0A8J6PJW9_9FLAO|nr:DinB family protein [Taishania pollutisoli]MBC9813131.1 DinB family protein [Taishania pollutisoli]MBX2950411.1 DinB family protein [Crocinitomicaceae bacterium]NGF76371.1 DinB family protein [Fluviicola sp. SGL-29]